jgi:hypothetical protein
MKPNTAIISASVRIIIKNNIFILLYRYSDGVSEIKTKKVQVIKGKCDKNLKRRK